MPAQQHEVDERHQFCSRLVEILPDLRAFARVLCRDDRADDLVQDAMVRAIVAMDQFQPGSNFKAWIFTILRNLHISSFRQRRFRFEPLEEVDRVMLQAPGQEQALAMRNLGAAVQNLAPVRREALILVVAHGLSYEQVAAICGCAIGTIKSRVARAREELHVAMNGETAVSPQLARTPMTGSLGSAAKRKEPLVGHSRMREGGGATAPVRAACSPMTKV
jgi:RNA polymerase sigma-70 factor (ECF subfamily)